MRKLTLNLDKITEKKKWRWTARSKKNPASRRNSLLSRTVRPSGGQRHGVARCSLWSRPFRGSVRQPPVNLRLWKEGACRGRGPVAPRPLHATRGLAHLARGTVSASAARRPCSVGRGPRVAGERRAAARTARSGRARQLDRSLGAQLSRVSRRSGPLPGASRWRARAARAKFATAAAAGSVGSTGSRRVPRRRGPDQLPARGRFD